MSQAEDLLNSLDYMEAEEDTHEHIHTVSDSDPDFVIDPTTRAIKNNTGNEIVLMQLDHGSECFTFEMPRYIENHDMTLCDKVKIHYINTGANNTKHEDIYDVKDLRVDPNDEEKVIWSWTVKRQATQYAGKSAFLVCFQCTTEGNIVTYEWHTDIFADVTVKKTMHHEEQIIIEYADILEEWRATLFGAGDSVESQINHAVEEHYSRIQAQLLEATSELRAKTDEALASIPEDYTETYKMADNAVRTRANAIVLDSEGDNFIIDGTSDDYLRGMKTFGKSTQMITTGAQMFDLSTAVTGMLEKDGSIVVDGAYVTSDFIPITPNTAYYQTEKETIRSKYYDANKVALSNDWDMQSPTAGTFTTPENAYYFRVTVRYTYINMYMLNIGTTGLPWEAYTGGKVSPNPSYPQKIQNRGIVRNLLVSTAESQVNNGVIFTVNEDKSVTVVGKSTSTNPIRVEVGQASLTPGEYYVSGQTENNGSTFVMYSDENSDLFQQYSGNDSKLTVTKDAVIHMYIVVLESATVVERTVHPMIRPITTTTNYYRPYNNGKHEIKHMLFGTNLFDVNSLEVKSNTSLEVSDDGYTVTVVGGSPGGYVSSYYEMPKDLLECLKGETLTLTIDSTYTEQLDVYAPVQLNIQTADNLFHYPAVYGDRPSTSFTIPNNAISARVSVYTNNTATALASDNRVTFRGIRMNLGGDLGWEPFKGTQSIVHSTDHGLAGIPVTTGGNYVDQNGQMWISDVIDCETKEYIQYVQRYEFDGSSDELWKDAEKTDVYDGVYFINCDLETPEFAFCSHYQYVNNAASAKPERRGYFDIHYGQFRVNAYGFSSLAEFVKHLADDPLVFYVPLSEPIKHQLSTEEINKFKTLHSNYSKTTVLNDSNVSTVITYNADTKIYFDKYAKPATDEQVQAAVDAWLTNYFTSAEGVSF